MGGSNDEWVFKRKIKFPPQKRCNFQIQSYSTVLGIKSSTYFGGGNSDHNTYQMSYLFTIIKANINKTFKLSITLIFCLFFLEFVAYVFVMQFGTYTFMIIISPLYFVIFMKNVIPFDALWLKYQFNNNIFLNHLFLVCPHLILIKLFILR